MNPAAAAAIVLIGALTLLNLLLTYGVVRRLRNYEDRLASMAPAEALTVEPPVGTPLPEFAATTVEGTAIGRERWGERPAYIGFFTTHCAPCRERLPEFVRFVADHGDREGALVVIAGGEIDTWGLAGVAREASGVAHVVVDDDIPGALAEAFGVNRYPTMLAVEGGVVTANAGIVAQLPAPTRT